MQHSHITAHCFKSLCARTAYSEANANWWKGFCDSLVAPAVNEVDGQEAVAQIVFKGIVERCLGTVENDGAGRSTAYFSASTRPRRSTLLNHVRKPEVAFASVVNT